MLAPGVEWVGNYGARRSSGRRNEQHMWIVISVGVAVSALLAILLLPRSRNAADGPLPRDVEARILLGERPEDIDGRRGDTDSAPDRDASDVERDR